MDNPYRLTPGYLKPGTAKITFPWHVRLWWWICGVFKGEGFRQEVKLIYGRGVFAGHGIQLTEFDRDDLTMKSVPLNDIDGRVLLMDMFPGEFEIIDGRIQEKKDAKKTD